MPLKTKTWITFIIIAALSVAVWFKYSYPQLSFADHSVDRKEAIRIAKDFLKNEKEIDPETYNTAVVFISEGGVTRYLQKTLGFDGFKAFIQEHDYDMFLWVVRFYKEDNLEQYKVSVSASTGQITGSSHHLDPKESREDIGKEAAKEKVASEIERRFGFDLKNNYTLISDTRAEKDYRVDYQFTWKKNSVSIPWSDKEKTGVAKLVTGGSLSGNEILSFNKNTFSVPSQFNHYLAKKKEVGKNLSTINHNIYRLLFIFAIFWILLKRNHLAMHCTKKFYVGVLLVSFTLSILGYFNYAQDILFGYNTLTPWKSYIARYAIAAFFGSIFVTVGILMPSLAGELIKFESLREHKKGSFLYYIQTTFFSRDVANHICFGYVVCLIMLGLQAALFEFGQRHLGVWVEYQIVGQLSTAYLPFLAAFTIGYKASFTEELMFRLYTISFFKKYLKNIIVAAVLSSLIFGFAHSGYPVFPMWFRGMEVSIMGFFLAFIYLKVGIIPVIVAHYLFDVFWGSSGYLLGKSVPVYFYSSLIILLLPLFFAGIAYIINRKTEEKPLKWQLNIHQIFNLGILKEYLKSHPEIFAKRNKEEVVKEIASHNWDLAVVEVAVEEALKEEGRLSQGP